MLSVIFFFCFGEKWAEKGRELDWSWRKQCSVVGKLGDECGASRRKPIIYFSCSAMLSTFSVRIFLFCFGFSVIEMSFWDGLKWRKLVVMC